MNDVYIEFEGTGREGTVAVGSYVLDAAKRLGVGLVCDCMEEEPSGSCAVKVIKGEALLSGLTKNEIEQLGASERKDRHRLACQTRIERPGELLIMTVKKEEKDKAAAEEKNRTEEYKTEFQQLPLEEKIASLVELEAIALGETISYVINSPYKAFGKVMDVMAGFGFEKEQRDKEAKVPDEHKDTEEDAASKNGKEKHSSNEPATEGDKKPSKRTARDKPGRKRRSKKKKEDEE